MNSTKFLIALLLFSSIQSLFGRIILPAIVSDHMVLQQQAEVTIWGWTTQSHETIKVWGSWNQDTVEVKAKAGSWEVSLATPVAGGPYSLEIMGKDHLIIEDVLIGEVWLGSGQSNMEMMLDSVSPGRPGDWNFREEIPKAEHPKLRLFTAERRTSLFPQDHVTGKWVVCSPEEARKFSAVGYFFSRMLMDSLNVPVGCIHSSWGGTPADAWTPAEWLRADALLAQAAEGIQKNSPSPRAPGILFNAMIHPLIRFRIAGVIWYQGESNRWRPQTYQPLMVKLIESWRAKWGYEFPFYFVQIAPYDYAGIRNSHGAPYIREAQLKTLIVPGTGMVVTADVGESTNIHPRKKRQVGERLALWALAKHYHFSDLVFSGPLYKSCEIRDHEMHISFDHAEPGLMIRGKQLNEVFIAGEDQSFYPAKAAIVDDKLVVSSPRVPEPVAVRYGFSDTDKMNLFNKAGLPASPFRTDNWIPVKGKH